MTIVASGDNTKIFALYDVLFIDNNKLTNAELKNIKEETAQYS
jgi:hypothetical protein